MKVYLSGPITTDKEHYKEHFAAAEKYLTEKGYEVTNPAKDEYDDEIYEKGHSDKWTLDAWLDYMKRDIELTSEHDAICLLIGWRNSPGAIIELMTAKKFGLELLEEFKSTNPSVKGEYEYYSRGKEWEVIDMPIKSKGRKKEI